MIRRLSALLLIVGIVVGARLVPAVPGAQALSGSLALGLLLLGGYLAGRLASALRLPQLSGYMLFGLLAGPQVGHLLDPPLLSALTPVDGLAVALIALSAGAELRPSWLRQNLRRVLTISLVLLVVVAGGLTALLLLLGERVPFLVSQPASAQTLIALTLAVAMASTSPLVVLAVSAETGARGPVSDALLGVSIVMDLIAVIGTAILIAFTRGALGVGTEQSLVAALSHELLGSLGAGLLVGLALVLYLRFVGREVSVVVASLCLLMAELGLRFHLEPLLLAMSAGITVGALGGARTERMTHAMERIGLPIFALFFGLLGASLDLPRLAGLGLLGGLLALARAGLLGGSVWLGARLEGAPREVQRYTFLGLISQAGVTLGIAVTLRRAFPGWGEAASDLLIGIAAANTLIGPILHRLAVSWAGELPASAAAAAAGTATGSASQRGVQSKADGGEEGVST